MRQISFPIAAIAGAVALASLMSQPVTAAQAAAAFKAALATPGTNNIVRLVGHGGGGGGGAGGHGGGGGAGGGRGGIGVSGLSAGRAGAGLAASQRGNLNSGSLSARSYTGVRSYTGSSSFKVHSGGSLKGGMTSHVYASPARPSHHIASARIRNTPSPQSAKKVTWDQTGSKWNGHHMDHHHHVRNQWWYTPTLLYDDEFCYWQRRNAISRGSLYLRQRYRNCLY